MSPVFILCNNIRRRWRCGLQSFIPRPPELSVFCKPNFSEEQTENVVTLWRTFSWALCLTPPARATRLAINGFELSRWRKKNFRWLMHLYLPELYYRRRRPTDVCVKFQVMHYWREGFAIRVDHRKQIHYSNARLMQAQCAVLVLRYLVAQANFVSGIGIATVNEREFKPCAAFHCSD
jgi:hypothetical protein